MCFLVLDEKDGRIEEYYEFGLLITFQFVSYNDDMIVFLQINKSIM